MDGKAMSIRLPNEIYHSVINYLSAKEIWDTLVVLFEGTTEVIENRRSLLIQQYEMFSRNSRESLTETYNRFNCLLNDLKQHGHVTLNKDMLIKFLRSLPSKWDDITIAIKLANNDSSRVVWLFTYS